MSTFDRWNKMAGLLNESAEPQQTVEAEETQEAIAEETQSSTMNESDLRGMIAELAKEILSERRATNANVALIQQALKSISDGSSEIQDRATLDQFANLTSDGKFGRNTKTQVRIFQDVAGLKDDGIVGPNTLRALINVFDNAGAKGAAIVAGMQMLLDQGVVARQGHGFEGKKRSKKAAPKPAAPEAPKSPKKKMTVATSDEDDFLSDEFLASLPEDPTFAQITADKGEAVAKALIGEPAPGDEPEDSDVTLPGMPDVFARGLKFTNVYGEKVLDIPSDDYEKAGAPDKAKLARANNVDKVMIS
jgi:lysozyme family protein